VIEQLPLAPAPAAMAVARNVAVAAALIARRRVRQPRENVGRRLCFADGTSSTVYRETVLVRPPAQDPAVLVVGFRLRLPGGRGHQIFEPTSLVNTPLFIGFPGFVSKLWLAHDEAGTYRGVYEWDGAGPAADYARALWRVLALVSVKGSIHYMVLPGLRRDRVLDDPDLVDGVAPVRDGGWWRPTATDRAPV
jgi:hypothetical protein